MIHNYPDIRSRILEEPLWHDMYGTPRYDPFTPELCPNIYAREVVLLLIACQACRMEFLVEMHGTILNPLKLDDDGIHYGDPPPHEGCGVGVTMNCDDLKIVEAWKHERFEWERKREFERDLPDIYGMRM